MIGHGPQNRITDEVITSHGQGDAFGLDEVSIVLGDAIGGTSLREKYRVLKKVLDSRSSQFGHARPSPKQKEKKSLYRFYTFLFRFAAALKDQNCFQLIDDDTVH